MDPTIIERAATPIIPGRRLGLDLLHHVDQHLLQKSVDGRPHSEGLEGPRGVNPATIAAAFAARGLPVLPLFFLLGRPAGHDLEVVLLALGAFLLLLLGEVVLISLVGVVQTGRGGGDADDGSAGRHDLANK